MKNLLIPDSLKSLEKQIDYFDGYIVGLDAMAINTNVFLNPVDISNLIKKYPTKECFILVNKNMKDKDLEKLKPLLIELDKYPINGLLIADPGVLQLTKKINFKKPLGWAQEHLTVNAKTINYWQDKGYSMAFLSNELTIDEIELIRKQTTVTLFCQVFGYIPMFVSKRFLVTNYSKHFNITDDSKKYYMEKEGIKHIVLENEDGTNVYYGKVLNAYLEYQTLKEMNIDYLVFNGSFLDDDIVTMAIKNYTEKLGKDKIDWSLDYKTTTGFYHQNTIYRVKKDEKTRTTGTSR